MARPTNALIVDDEPHVRIFVKMLLKQQGIETTWEAGDGVQALAMVAQQSTKLSVTVAVLLGAILKLFA